MTSLNLDVSELFNQFAGKEIPMKEEEKTYTRRRTGEVVTYTQVSPADENDPTIKAMQDHAQANGLSLRLWWPGVFGTMDFQMSRVNAHIEKAEDGKWRIEREFRLG